MPSADLAPCTPCGSSAMHGPRALRHPAVVELGIVVALAAIAGFRNATTKVLRERSFEAEAMFLLTFAALLVATVSVMVGGRGGGDGGGTPGSPVPLTPTRTPVPVRSPLDRVHAEGVAVGALCLPIVCVALVTSGADGARAPFWLTTACSMYVLLRQFVRGGFVGVVVWAAVLAVVLGPFSTIGAWTSFGAVVVFGALAVALQRALGMSQGEVCVVGEAVIIGIDALWSTAKAPLGVDGVVTETAAVDAAVCVFGVGAAIAGVLLAPFLAKYAVPNALSGPRRPPVPTAAALLCFAILLTTTFVGEAALLQKALGENPYLWLARFLADPWRLGAMVYWAVGLAAMSRVAPNDKTSALPNIVIRKFFHFVAVVLFTPVIVFDHNMMRLAFVVAFKFLVFAEYIRVMRLPGGAALHSFMQQYIDSRDAGCAILTHIYLVVGCAVSVWLPLVDGPNRFLLPLCGVLVLGVGDAAAACAGTFIGRSTWPGTRKTLEGTSAGFLSMVAFVLALQAMVGHRTTIISPRTFQSIQLAAAVAVACLLETFTKQIDNLFLPLYFFGTLLLFSAPA